MTRAVELPPLQAPAPIMAQARENCAARAEARGETALAESYRLGGQDAGWGLRHEVNKLIAEAGKGGAT